MTFQRENRYIVIKRKDLDAAAAEGAVDASFAEVLDIVSDSLPTRECLVIESDWPEYEPAWRMIQARVEGATLSPAHVEDGEEVEVVGSAWRNIYNNGFDHLGPFPPSPGGPVLDEPLMTVRQHKRIVAALSAPPAAGVSEGYKWYLVPKEDTEAFNAACSAANDAYLGGVGPCGVFIAGYRAMLAAAPTPPASEQQRAVVMPEWKCTANLGWNACLDELLRLNPHLAKGEGV